MIYGERKATYPIQATADMNYCDICKYIDEHQDAIKEVGTNPSEEEKIFRYLYGVIYSIAVKERYFCTWADYDNYALYAATDVYMVLRNKLAREGEIFRGKPITRIKNTLDYIKNDMPHLKVNYQQTYFRMVADPSSDDRIDTERAAEEARQNIQQDYNYGLSAVMEDSINILPQIIDRVVEQSPFTDPVMLKNLKISCKLSLLNSLILPSKIKEEKKSYEALCKAFSKEQSMTPILWHLDSGMSGYVSVLINKIKVKLTEEINDSSHEFDLDENILDAIMASGFESSTKNNMEEE